MFATNGSYRNARGIFRKGHSKNKENVPSLPEVGGSIADSSAEVQGDNINDLLNGNSSGTSFTGKGKNFSENINIPPREAWFAVLLSAVNIINKALVVNFL